MEFINHNPDIYVICGKAQNGKNTVGNIIKKRYESDSKKVINLQFSSYLKEYAKNITNWDGQEETKPRVLLQNLGVELIKQKIDSKMLIRRMIEDIKIYSYFYDVIIINDARFPDEIEAVRNNFRDVKVIRVIRDLKYSMLEGETHLTETALDNYQDYDYIIYNVGTTKELETNVYKLFEEGKNE